jgi:cytochrome c-type biogenesis protein
MDTANLSIPIAFVAGLLSFASPCVLPLVPAYMGYLGGTTLMSSSEDGARRETARLFLHSLLFVLGFGLVFIPLGASATFVGRLLFDSTILLQRLGGVLLVVFGMRLMAIDWSRRRWLVAAAVVALATFLLDSGLVVQGSITFDEYTIFWLGEALMMGLAVAAGANWQTWQQVLLAVVAGFLNFQTSYDSPIPNLAASALIALAIVLLNRTDFFYAEKKIEMKQTRQATYARSLLFGIVFAAGWTPCVGPILAGILILASQLDTVGQGILLLVAYTLGLGIPFLLVGLAFGPLSRWLRRMNRYLGALSVVSGVLLVVMGVLVFTDSLTFLAQYGSFFELELP